ncbi:MAG: response regulator, partial [Chloroflexi bacterium]|nr:response regulator [Chloroflexota bacterium]
NPGILPGEQTSEFYREMWDTLVVGQEWQGEFRNRKKNGELYWVSASIPERVQVQFSFSRGDYTVNADPTQLQQVITNLTVNARDALPQGGALYFKLSHLTVHAGETPPDPNMVVGEWVKLTITDSGTGIAPEVLPHIFEPFFSTKEVGQGTGLGLAQVYGIVKQHEGFILVESQIGKGTTFTIYLPSIVTRERSVTTTEVLTEIPLGEGETILLVEDNQILLEATRAVLISLNYRVITAVNGEDALNLYRDQLDKIDLILADVVMPNFDGFELVEALQQHTPPPKMLLMSGFPRDKEQTSEVKQFISGWLQKPVDLYQLAEALRAAL